MKILPTRIVAARKRAQLTQRELAEALNVTVQAVSQWENGKTDPSSRITQIAETLQCSEDFLIGLGEENNERESFNCSHDFIIDVIRIEDLGRYMSTDSGERFSFRQMSTTSTIDASGWLFGVIVDASSDHFVEGDILIFDNGLAPEEGDYAAMLTLSGRTGRVSFTKEGNVKIDGAQGIVAHLSDGPFETSDLKPIVLSPEVLVDAELGPMVLMGTLVERRTFRRGSGRLKRTA